jgi:hypothetical protein
MSAKMRKPILGIYARLGRLCAFLEATTATLIPADDGTIEL